MGNEPVLSRQAQRGRVGSMLLTPQEIIELTGRVKYRAQARQLAHLGIPYRVRTDGSLIVLRSDIDGRQSMRREPQLRLA